MKKILITLGTLIIIAVALPIIGNSFMQSAIEERVSELESYGLESVKTETSKSYLHSQQHFEFLLKDATAFVEYLNNYADGQIPPYVNAMFEGVLIGVDLEYSNLFFSKAMSLDVYPMSISKEMAEGLQKQNPAFYEYLENFLRSKGILYHIDYNIISQDFNGFVKDIKESYVLKNKTQLLLTLKGFGYEGNGELIAPKRLTTSLQKIRFEILQKDEQLVFNLSDLKTASSYESKSTYLSSLELEDFEFVAQGARDRAKLKLQNTHFNASSNTQGEFAEIDSKSSIELIEIDSKELRLDMKNFNLDMAVDSLDKESFQALVELLSKAERLNSVMLEAKLKESLTRLLSKGLVFTIADFSVEDITLEKTQALKGFHLQSQLRLQEDKEFAKKLQISPLLLLTNIDIETKLRLSRELYAKILEKNGGQSIPKEYLKEDGDGYVFDLNFKQGETTLNGKRLQ